MLLRSACFGFECDLFLDLGVSKYIFNFFKTIALKVRILEKQEASFGRFEQNQQEGYIGG